MSEDQKPDVTPAEPVKRKPGRPTNASKGIGPKVEPKFKMKASPNWETFEADSIDTPDRLHIDKALVPEGMALMWVTDAVRGMAMPQHRGSFERKGWTPVHQSDFDGQFNGMFMPRDREGEILVDGLVLMARPKELSDRARKLDQMRAREQVNIKEQSLRGGDINTSLDSRHPTALRSNTINKSFERISVPEDK